MNDLLKIGNKTFNNRFFLGTGKFGDDSIIKDIVNENKIEIVTVALRRVDFNDKKQNIVNYIPKNCTLMANTSGARNSDEAVRLAHIAKKMGCGDFIKIEVISDNKYLMPDNYETLKTIEILANEGFTVLPYMSPDIYDAKRMVDAGAAAIMPLGAPIGTNRGLKTKELIKILIDEIKLPIIVDAGIGKPSHACEAMEMGASAVLVNTSIAVSKDPEGMAKAFCDAVKAGRAGYLSGFASTKNYASASSPLTGFLY